LSESGPSQNFVEFWAVATRPGNANGLNLTPEQTFVELSDFEQLFDLLPELPVHDEWVYLVKKYRVSGKSVHDARLVVAMIVNGIGSILTFNGPDFARYGEITTLDPALVS
jgi:predicted nucleic acid-binding protein